MASAPPISSAFLKNASDKATPTMKWRCDVCKKRFFAEFDHAVACEVKCQEEIDASRSTTTTTTTTGPEGSSATAPIAAAFVTQDTLEPPSHTASQGMIEPPRDAASKVKVVATTATATAAVIDSKAVMPSHSSPTTVVATTDAKQKPPSPIITPTKAPPRSSRSNWNEARSTRRNVNNSGSKIFEHSTTVVPLVGAIKESLSKHVKSMKTNSLTEKDVELVRDMLQRLETLEVNLDILQKTLIGTVVSKFKKHPLLGPTARALVDDWKAIAAGGTKKRSSQAKRNSKTNGKIAAKTQCQAKQPQHSFFRPRVLSTKSDSATAKASRASRPQKPSAPINPFFAPRKKAPSATDVILAETESLKRKLPPPPKLSPETTKAVAAIFQNQRSAKQILAEQRRVELAASREAERKREQERNAKRAALFAARESDASRMAFHNNNNKNGNSPMLPVAPRFPVPNHVLGAPDRDSNTETLCGDSILPEHHPFRSQPLVSSSTIPKTRSSTACKPTSWLSSPSALDTFDVNTSTFTSIQRALFETFSILPPKDTSGRNKRNTINIDHENSGMLWSDTFGRMDKDNIVGAKAKQVFCQLVECIDHWRVARNESLERTAERHRKLAAARARGKPMRKPKKKTKKRPRRAYDYYEDDDWLVGDDDDDEFPSAMAPLCLLTGPPSSGKTSIVHAVARLCGNCKVLEINTSRARSGTALKHAIEEATQSNSSLEMLQNKTKQNSIEGSKQFFASRNGSRKSSKRVLEDSDSEADDSGDEETAKKKSSVTIVLIDEVDILFEEGDSGFWTALGALARATKCPIVLTANDCPPQLDPSGSRLPCSVFELEKPSPTDCASKLWGVASLQQQKTQKRVLRIRPELARQGSEAIQARLATIAEACGCDLRKLLHELQVFASIAASGVQRDSPPVGWTADGESQPDGSNPTHTALSTTVSSTTSPLFNEIPTVSSLEPSRVPMGRHSIVVVKGTNFHGLLPDAGGPLATQHQQPARTATIRIGPRTISRWHVVDDTTLLMQCPPYEPPKEDPEWADNPSGRWIQRILPVSIACRSQRGLYTSPPTILASETLADGTSLAGTVRPMIEYVLPGEDRTKSHESASHANCDDSDDDDDNQEFDSKPETDDANVIQKAEVTSPSETPTNDDEIDDGSSLETWKIAVAGWDAAETVAVAQPRTPPKTTPEDVAVASRLEDLANHARDASDASLLEDFGEGLPYLSGACRGFGFDYTEDCCAYPSGGSNTLRMHEKSKP